MGEFLKGQSWIEDRRPVKPGRHPKCGTCVKQNGHFDPDLPCESMKPILAVTNEGTDEQRYHMVFPEVQLNSFVVSGVGVVGDCKEYTKRTGRTRPLNHPNGRQRLRSSY